MISHTKDVRNQDRGHPITVKVFLPALFIQQVKQSC